jgi:hypothetical protein
MTEPFWLTATMVVAIHDEQLAIHGGSAGLRDHALLESALDRPRNKWAYEQAGLPELAAPTAMELPATIRSSTATSAPPCWRSTPFSASTMSTSSSRRRKPRR